MALSLDGDVSGGSGSSLSLTVSLTTTAGSGEIVVAALANDGPVVSVVASGLSFSPRKVVTVTGGGGQTIEEWVAPYSSNFSGNITVTQSGAAFMEVVAWGIGGAPLASPFDSNASLPFQSLSNSTQIGPASTTNAHDFIYGIALDNNSVDATTWLPIPVGGNPGFLLVGYQIVSAAQPALIFGDSVSSGAFIPGILDAMIAASGGGATPNRRTLMGVGS